MFDIITFIIGIIFTILIIVGIHEFGHFFVARLLGIKVLRFSIGFGKTLFCWHDKKGTEYVLAAVPLGGYVKILDETEGPVLPEEQHLAFNRQPIYKRVAVVLAGPLFNFILAFFLYWFIFMIGFTSIIPLIGKIIPHSIAAEAGLKPKDEIISIDHQSTLSFANVVFRLIPYLGDTNKVSIETKQLDAKVTQSHTLDLAGWNMDPLKPDPLGSLGIEPFEPEIPAIIDKISAGSPAEQSNLKKGDRILAIDKQKIKDWLQAIEIIHKNPDKQMKFTLKREGEILTIPVYIGFERNLLLQKHGFLGISPQFEWPKNLLRNNQYGIFESMSHAVQNISDFTRLNFLLFGKLITGKVSLKSLGGPITIFGSAGTALNNGILPFLSYLAFLSIAIGVINILPIPGLDGGHLLFYAIEFVRGRPLSINAQTLLYRFGLIFLMILIVQAIANDLMRL